MSVIVSVLAALIYILVAVCLLVWLHKHRNRYTRPLCSHCGAELNRVDLRRPDLQPEVVFKSTRSKLVCSHCNQKTVVEVVYDGPWLNTWPEASSDNFDPPEEFVRVTGYTRPE